MGLPPAYLDELAAPAAPLAWHHGQQITRSLSAYSAVILRILRMLWSRIRNGVPTTKTVCWQSDYGMVHVPSDVIATYFGVRIRTWDPFTYAEQQRWLAEMRALVPTLNPFYGQLVDLRDLHGLGTSDPELIEEGMNLVLAYGLKRSAVIVSDPVLAMEIKRMAWESGVYEWERYLDASSEPDWERLALGWIDQAIDPGY